jgi:hypothetical protein
MMLRGCVVASALVLGACEMCGPPAEPLIDVRVDLAAGVAVGSATFLHLQMLDGAGQPVTQYSRPAVSTEFPFEHSLGNCDGLPRRSGEFTIRGWLDEERATPTPHAGDPQGADLVAVTCNASSGCVGARDAALTIAPP